MGRKHLYPPSVRHGIPRLGKLPRGWTKTTFGEQLQVVERPVEIRPDATYQLVTAKRNRGGIVARETLRGDQILTAGQFRVEAGDFITSNRQIIHGACGIVPPELDGAIVSGEYTVLRARNGLHLPFFAHYTHTDYFQKTCFFASVGVDVEKMVFDADAWLKLPWHLPTSKEQRGISRVLEDAQTAAARTYQLIEEKRRIRDEVAAVLFSQRLRDLRPVSLSSVASVATGSTPNREHPEFFSGDTPWVKTTEVQFCEIRETEEHVSEEGICAARLSVYPPGTVLVAMYGQGKTRGQSAILGVHATTNQACAAIVAGDALKPWFLYYYLASRYEQLRIGGQGSNQDNLNLSMISRFPIRVPGKGIQQQIVDHLDHWTAAIAAEERKLAALERVKTELARRLLTGELRVKP